MKKINFEAATHFLFLKIIFLWIVETNVFLL